MKKFSGEASNLHLFLISQPEEKQLKKSEIIIMTPLLIFSPSLGGTDKGAWQNKKRPNYVSGEEKRLEALENSHSAE